MSTPRHQRLSEVFLAVSELPEEERGAYLDEACRDDPELRTRIESMLLHDTDVPQILKTGAVGYQAELHTDELPEHIGPYRILDKLGEGGMGVVYLAEQERPGHPGMLKDPFLKPLHGDPEFEAIVANAL